MKEINLFKSYLQKPKAETELGRRLRLGTMIGLGLYLLVIAGVFSYWLIVQRQLEEISNQVESQQKAVASYKNLETMQVFLNQRLGALVRFFGQESFDYPEGLGRLEALASEGVALTGIEVDAQGFFKVSGEASNAVALADFIDRLLSSEADDFARAVRLSLATREQEGHYSFTIEIDAQNSEQS